MGSRLKQFTSTALAVTMALTSIPLSPITAHATNTRDTLENSAGEKGGNSSVTTGGDWANDFGGNQGIRISLVSADDPREVVSIALDGHTRVVDIIFGTKQQFHDNCEVKQGRAPIMFSSTKAQELSTTINKIEPIYLTDYLIDLTQKESKKDWYRKLTSEDMAKYLDNPAQVKTDVENLQYNIRWLFNAKNSKNYTTNGNKLRDWLLSNSKGEQIGVGLSAESGASLATTVIVDGSAKTLAKTTTADKRTNGAKSKADTSKTVRVVRDGDWNDRLGLQIRDATARYNGVIPTSGNLSLAKSNRDNCIEWKSDFLGYLSGAVQSGKITSAYYKEYARLANLIDSNNKEEYNTYCKRINNLERRINMSQAIFDRLMGVITVYGAEGTTTDSDTSESTGASTTEEVKTNYEKQLLNHLSYILQLTDENNNPYFVTKDMLDEKGNIRKVKDGSRNMTIFDPALEDETHTEFRIMVEPLDWFTPHNTVGKPLIDKRFYGTLSNIAQAFDHPNFNVNKKYLNNGMSEHLNRNSFNKVSWCAMTTGTNSDDLEKAFKGKFIFDPVPNNVTGAGKTYRIGADIVPNRFLADTSRPYMNTDEERPHQLGWGVQVYWPKAPAVAIDTNTTRTWDEPTFPDAKPGPSPKTTDPTAKLKVTKWYYVEDDTTETVVAVKTQPISGSPIKIENEGTDPDNSFWEVNGWSTGLSDSTPTDNDTSTTYEQYSDNNKGTYAGTEPTILTMEKEDPDKVLYVKLVAKKLATSKVDIVKVFEKTDGSNPMIDIEKDVVIGEGGYDPTDSRGTYTENVQSEEPSKPITVWDDILDQGPVDNGNPIIKERDTKTIYIDYNGTPPPPAEERPTDKVPLLLHEDELSYGYTLKSLRADGTLAYWQEQFESRAGSVRYCSGHERERSDGSTYTAYCSYRSRSINDNFYSLRVGFNNQNPNFITDISESADSAGNGSWTISGFKGISGGLTARSNPNASFLLFRNKDKDRVTLYPGKNDASTKALTNKLGITAESYTPAHTRIAQEGTGSLKDTFTINFVDNGSDRTLSWVWKGSRGCSESGSWSSTATNKHGLSDVNNAYTFTNNVRALYELGNAGTGTTVPAKAHDKAFSNVFKNNLYSNVSQDGEIKFYPYIKMVYNDKSNSSPKPVYVTSENLSTIPAFTKIEAGVWKNDQYDADAVNGNNPVPNVSIITDMWSTSGNSMIFKNKYNIPDKRIILPGGSAFDVRMNEVNTGGWTLPIDAPKTSTKLGYRVWSVCVDDASTGLVASGTTAPTLLDAKQRVDELDKTVKATVPQYGLAQVVSKGIIDYKGYLKNMVFNNSKGYSFVPTADGMWGDIKLSTDRKYYLRLAGIGMGAEFNSTVSNFDLIDGGVKQQTVYKVSSDTSGNVMVAQNGTIIGTLKATDRDVTKFVNSNNDIKQLEYATGIVTNYVQSIDRQKGSNRKGERWYNEAFDGVSVLMSYLSYDIGFGKSIVDGPGKGQEASTTRLSVLDPRLSGRLDYKGDLYNFDEATADDKVRSTMFVTAKVTDTQIPGELNHGYVIPQEPDGYFGTYRLKNGEQWNIMLPDMKCFAYSKMFYIPNATVMDLRSN